jgi:hypothetical protein
MSIQEFKYSLQHTHFRKRHVRTGIISFVGKKPIVDEDPHSEQIGKSKSTCLNLYNVGTISRAFGYNLLGVYDNHVWLPQIDESETPNKGNLIYVCINCGSVLANENFVANVETQEFESTFKKTGGENKVVV